MAVSKINRPASLGAYQIGGEPLFTINETANALRVSPRTVRRLLDKKRLPFLTIGKRRFIYRERLQELVDRGDLSF